MKMIFQVNNYFVKQYKYYYNDVKGRKRKMD